MLIIYDHIAHLCTADLYDWRLYATLAWENHRSIVYLLSLAVQLKTLSLHRTPVLSIVHAS